MRYSVPLIALCCLSLLGCGGALQSTPIPDARTMLSAEPAPLRVRLPEPRRWTLANGIQVLFLEDRELPLVSGTLLMRTGRYWQPDIEPGALSALAYVMRTGGAGELDADAFEQELVNLGASLSISFGAEDSSLSFSSLSADFPKVLELALLMAQEPRLDEAKLALWQAQSLESIRRRRDNPFTVARTSFRQLLLGDEFYGRVLESEHVLQLTREYLDSIRSSLVRADGAYLLVTGAISERELRRLLDQELSQLPRDDSSVEFEYPPLTHEAEPAIFFVPGEYVQASVIMGTLAPGRLPPDYPEITVLNEVFGTGGFSSRLMRRVREELGLAYWISGSISPDNPQGITSVALQTGADSLTAAMEEVFAILQSLKAEGALEDEIDTAQRSIANSFVFNFSSPSDILGRIAAQELRGFPADYDETFVPKIRAVTNAGLRQAATDHLPETGQKLIVVVGPEASYEDLRRLVSARRDLFPSGKVVRGEFAEKFQLR